MKIKASNIVLRLLGLLLLTAAILKMHELLTVPVANKDIWSWRPFLIFQVEFELALGIWLLSGVLKRLAWLASVGCFGLFCCVTLYKGITGAASCGCFGKMHVNPWVTLVFIDLPSFLSLLLFRTTSGWRHLYCSLRMARRALRLSFRPLWRKPSRLRLGVLIKRSMKPLFSLSMMGKLVMVIVVVCVTTSLLALNEPAVVTSTYEFLEPETWVGKEFPILKYIDIADKLRIGTWLVLFYHHDCPHCDKAIAKCEQIVRELYGNMDYALRFALIEVPPYGEYQPTSGGACVLGRMDKSKKWILMTPTTCFITDGRVHAAWEGEFPTFAIDMETHEMSQNPALRTENSL